jgi:hypothetical protein
VPLFLDAPTAEWVALRFRCPRCWKSWNEIHDRARLAEVPRAAWRWFRYVPDYRVASRREHAIGPAAAAHSRGCGHGGLLKNRHYDVLRPST